MVRPWSPSILTFSPQPDDHDQENRRAHREGEPSASVREVGNQREPGRGGDETAAALRGADQEHDRGERGEVQAEPPARVGYQPQEGERAMATCTETFAPL